MEGRPKRFEEQPSAQRWLTAAFDTWAANLTPDQRDAVSAYKFDAYEPINRALRYGEALDRENETVIDLLDQALATFRLPEPIIAHRGFASNALRAGFDQLPGNVIRDDGYWSSSLLESIARTFAASEPSELAILAEVEIPGGAHVGAFVGAPDLIRDMGEVEILLPRGSRLYVHEIDSTGHPPTLRLEVIT